MDLTPDARTQILHRMAAALQDNLGNRVTVTLVNGFLAELDALLPRALPAAAPAAQTGGEHAELP